METNYLPEFIALAEYGSSYVAAEKLFVSQSSLLRHVQSIEDEFGVPLFDRTRKGFILNQQGQLFLPYAKQILSLKNHCYGALHHEEESQRVVRLCAQCKIISLMIAFRQAVPEIRLEFYKADNPEGALYEGQVDVAFISSLKPGLTDNFQTIRYASEEVLVLVHEDHPLAQFDSVTLERLREEDFIKLPEDVVNEEEIYSRIGNGAGPNVVATVPTGSDVIRMVMAKQGVALFHGQNSTVPPRSGLKVLTLDPPIHYELNLCFRKDAPLNRAAERFVNFARRWTAEHQDINRSLIEDFD
ncbi:MAG: LysR family transcriptional regulator [Clostridia bacterium]|nr:LysR family transcriptional regulator [Clostridia bacterium]